MAIDPKLMAFARIAVANGAERLNTSPVANKRHPWHLNVRPRDLRQDNGFQCVLAHIFGDYWKGLAALGFGPGDASAFTNWTDSEVERIAACGFALGREYMTFEALNAAWLEKIDSIRNPVRTTS